MADEKKVPLFLTMDQCGIIGKILDSVSGMDNARVLLPIYDELKRAVMEAQPAVEVLVSDPANVEAKRKRKNGAHHAHG